MLGAILWAIIGGTILGVLARLILPGRQNISMLWTIVVGIAAMLIGGVVATWLSVGETSGIDWIKHGIQLALGVLGIALVAGISRSTPAGRAH